MVNLVFIHGRDQQSKDAEALKQEWLDTFKKGLAENGLTFPEEDVKVVMPYYGDLLVGLIAKMAEKAAKLTTRGETDEQNDEEKSQFIYDYLSQVIQQAGITQEQMDSIATEENEPALTERGYRNWAPSRRLMKIADKFALIREPIIEWLTNDVHHYLRSYGVTTEIDAFVLPSLETGPCVVVAHSLGTVIGYNLLSANAKLPIDSYFTLGSPLGVNAVKKWLKKPLRMPECIQDKWYSCRDKKDYVALVPLTNKYFKIDPEITNYNEIKNNTEERHGIEGYLSDAHMAKLIYDRLQVVIHAEKVKQKASSVAADK